MAGEVFPFLAPILSYLPFLLRDKLDNAQIVPSLTIPTLLIHGTADEVCVLFQLLVSLFRVIFLAAGNSSFHVCIIPTGTTGGAF